MTSVLTSAKQTNGHFIALTAFTLKGYTPGTGSGGSWNVGSFGTGSNVLQYQLLKDMGKTVVSSLRVFREVAPVGPINQGNPYTGDTNVTYGVSTTTAGAYFTGFIELGYEGFGAPDPVARFNTL